MAQLFLQTFFAFVLIFLQTPRLLHCDNTSTPFFSFKNSTFLWTSLVEVPSDTFSSTFLPPYVNFTGEDVLLNDRLSDNCREAVAFSLHALHARQLWAARLFNSWAKFPPSGTLVGTLVDFGDYDQCLVKIEDENEKENESRNVNNSYCLVDVALPMPRPMPHQHNYFHSTRGLLPSQAEVEGFRMTSDSNVSKAEQLVYLANGSVYRHLEQISSVFYYEDLQIGVCWPANCSQADVVEVMKRVVSRQGFELGRVTCEQNLANTKGSDWKLDSVQKMAVAFFLSSISLALLAALYDRFFFSRRRGHPHANFLIWFSPLRNIRKLIDSPSSEDDLSCIHGMRVLTLVWIVMGHSINWNTLNSFRQTFTVRQRLTEMIPQPLYRGILTVDTFFFLSGLLTAYVTLKYTGGRYERFSSVMFIALRYLRLTPQLAIWMLFTILLPALFDGPLWRRYIAVTEQCYDNWWVNIAYLQNLVDVGRICGLHTWYLAADMQLHWISLLPVILWLRNRNQGLLLVKVLIGASLVVSSLTIYLQKLPPGSVITSNNDFFDENAMPKAYLRFVYKPWTHAYVFFLGFLLGDYIKSNLKLLKQRPKLSKTKKYLLWAGALSAFAFSIYSTVPWLYGRPYDPLSSATLFPLNLLSWSLGMATSVWLCVTGNGGLLGRLLSSKVFRPLSRTTYAVYLTHVWVVWVTAGARRAPIDLSAHSLLLLFAAEVLVAFGIGFLFTILFESPVIYALHYIKKVCILENENEKEDEKLEKEFVGGGSDEVLQRALKLEERQEMIRMEGKEG